VQTARRHRHLGPELTRVGGRRPPPHRAALVRGEGTLSPYC